MTTMKEDDFTPTGEALDWVKVLADRYADCIYHRNGKSAPWGEGADPQEVVRFYRRMAEEFTNAAHSLQGHADDLCAAAREATQA